LGKRHGGSSAAAILGGGPTGKKQARKSAPTEGGNPHQFGGGNEENGKKRAENPAKMVEMKNEWLTSTEKGQMERRVSMEQMEKEVVFECFEIKIWIGNWTI
jgi:hypothetical protein